jgi:hypothetical protein
MGCAETHVVRHPAAAGPRRLDASQRPWAAARLQPPSRRRACAWRGWRTPALLRTLTRKGEQGTCVRTQRRPAPVPLHSPHTPAPTAASSTACTGEAARVGCPEMPPPAASPPLLLPLPSKRATSASSASPSPAGCSLRRLLSGAPPRAPSVTSTALTDTVGAATAVASSLSAGCARASRSGMEHGCGRQACVCVVVMGSAGWRGVGGGVSNVKTGPGTITELNGLANAAHQHQGHDAWSTLDTVCVLWHLCTPFRGIVPPPGRPASRVASASQHPGSHDSETRVHMPKSQRHVVANASRSHPARFGVCLGPPCAGEWVGGGREHACASR